MSTLANLVKNRLRKGYVVPEIDEFLLMAGGDDRRDGKFHPSDLSGRFCPRAWSLYNFHPDGLRIKNSSINPRLARIFGNGHAVHTRIQSYLAAMGILWGRYINVRTGEVHTGFPPDESQEWVYTEVSLRHDEDRIKGHTDGILNLHGKKYVLEVKSINEQGFQWLNGNPKDMHEEQGMIYLHCLDWIREQKAKGEFGGFVDEFDELPFEGVIFLYENKNTQELEEFFRPMDGDRIDEMMQGKRKLMYEALEFERTGEHPQCRCDPRRKSPLCKAIPFLDV